MARDRMTYNMIDMKKTEAEEARLIAELSWAKIKADDAANDVARARQREKRLADEQFYLRQELYKLRATA